LDKYEATKIEHRCSNAREVVKKRKLAMHNEGELMWAWKKSANGEVSDVKYSQIWNASLYLTPADKMCDNQNNRCKSQHVTVLNECLLNECLHVLGSRLCYQKKEGSAAFLANEVKRLGCLYKEICLEVNDVNSQRFPLYIFIFYFYTRKTRIGFCTSPLKTRKCQ
jgi:hypothetical protein